MVNAPVHILCLFRVTIYMRKYRAYTDQDIITHAANVKSLAGLLKKLNLKVVGGNYINMKRLLQKLKVDCSHWTGQGWNKDQQLKDWSDYTKVAHLKGHLIKERGHACEECERKTWNKTPIPLEVHHLDGDRTNNKLLNLELLCCNCHAQTDNWRNKKRN